MHSSTRMTTDPLTASLSCYGTYLYWWHFQDESSRETSRKWLAECHTCLVIRLCGPPSTSSLKHLDTAGSHSGHPMDCGRNCCSPALPQLAVSLSRANWQVMLARSLDEKVRCSLCVLKYATSPPKVGFSMSRETELSSTG